jgi:hypothetical protein
MGMKYFIAFDLESFGLKELGFKGLKYQQMDLP